MDSAQFKKNATSIFLDHLEVQGLEKKGITVVIGTVECRNEVDVEYLPPTLSEVNTPSERAAYQV